MISKWLFLRGLYDKRGSHPLKQLRNGNGLLLIVIGSGTDYDVQIKVMSQGKELEKSAAIRVYTSAAGKRLDVTKAPYMAAGDGSMMDTQAIQKAIND